MNARSIGGLALRRLARARGAPYLALGRPRVLAVTGVLGT